jgi:hypothetical protein
MDMEEVLGIIGMYYVLLAPVSLIAGLQLGRLSGDPLRGAVFAWVFGPVGILLLILRAAVIGKRGAPTCPYCLDFIIASALKCKSCGSTIPRCPACGHQLGLKGGKECRQCGKILASAGPADDSDGR